MIKLHHTLTISLGVAVVSCNKAKEIAAQARSAISSEASSSGNTDDGPADPELASLVDQTEEGVIFRTDLPFPSRLEVTTVQRMVIDGRSFENSELGQNVTSMKGTRKFVTKVERAGDQVRYTMSEATFTLPVSSENKNSKPDVAQLLSPSGPRLFTKKGGKWSAEESRDFRTAVISREILPVFDELLEDCAAAPRGLWLGRKRIKPGTEFNVSKDNLGMLVSGKVKGNLKLTFLSIGSVHGHPCGVLSVSGEYYRDGFSDFEGRVMNEDVAVKSGKIWLSLLYPIVLKEELETVRTMKTGSDGNLSSRIQGSVKASVVREWKAITP